MAITTSDKSQELSRLQKLVNKSLRQQISNIVEQEALKAAQRVEDQVKALTESVTLKIMRHVVMETNAESVTIHIGRADFNDNGADQQ